MTIDAHAPTRGTARAGLAQRLTDLLAPTHLLVAVQLLVGVVAGETSTSGLAWGALAALFTAVLPYAFVLRGVRRGRYGDRHVKDRKQRLVPLAFAGASVATGVAVLALAGAPGQLLALNLATLLGLVLILATTLVWKISVHSGVAAGVASVASMVLPPVAVVGVLLVAAVGWSRVELRDHTRAQALGGAVLGAAVAATLFATFR
ncbi:hypothetical protein [Pseudokineococcus sp. 1T1Z-3]|uniref:hypothetical protein n=1 Tax=Pseudokineococcus sp. 1T1Z-3 TaxID=3132745 RepID=UPI0030B74F8B